MKLDREKIKAQVNSAVHRAFSERNTINVQLMVGLSAMVDAIVDEIEAQPDPTAKKKVA